MFQEAINAKYPDITVMTSYSNNTVSNHTEVPQAAAADYHQYSTPDAFVLTQYGFFDQNPVNSRTLIGLLLTYQGAGTMADFFQARWQLYIQTLIVSDM
jgi:hypothetical protein